MDVDQRARAGQLPALSEPERHKLLVEWNATARAYSDQALVHALFEAQVARAPAATAVVCVGSSLTYSELNARANRLAKHLRTSGVGPDMRVAICVERSLEMVVGLLAILKAGGAYVPLDPAYPAHRLGFMLADSAPAAVLTHGPARVALDAAITGLDVRPPVIDLLADAALWAVEAATDRTVPGLTSRNLAYVIYTSGSTGTPKGVMVEHRGVVNLSQAQGEVFRPAPESRVLQFASLSFDAATFEMVMALAQGGSLHLRPSTGSVDGRALSAFMSDQKISHATLTPAVLALLPTDVAASAAGTMVVAGEALPWSLAEAWAQDRRVFNAYGPTEATVWATVHRHQAGEPETGLFSPIGRPIANTRIYLLDEHLQPVPIGVAGEIHIGGAGVARGYLNRPELTAEKFIASPFVEGDRLYKTGDLGRYRPDGVIEFLGRNDFQVKIRGFRIELGEIEARLASHPGVREAVVLAREDIPGDKRLVGYYTAEAPIEVEALRSHLAGGLPEYMVPAAYIRLDALPLTPNGKLDRKALPAPDGEAYAQRAYEAPQGSVEEALAAIWAEVLGLDRVGRHDNFFDLGGHSLAATRILVRLREQFDAPIGVDQVLARPTVAELAIAMRGDGRRDVIRPIAREPKGAAFDTSRIPLSHQQTGIWIAQHLAPTSQTFNAQRVVQLKGAISGPVMQACLDEIVAQHEIYRTTFHVGEDGVPFQTVRAATAAALRCERAAPGRETDDIVADAIGRRFDLDKLPLAEWTLIQTSADSAVLVHVEHHLIHDGWSGNAVLAAFLSAYRRRMGLPRADSEPPSSAGPEQYSAYVAWQRSPERAPAYEGHLEFWRRKLVGLDFAPPLPGDRPRPPEASYRGAQIRVPITPDALERVKAECRRAQVTSFAGLMAAFAVLIHKFGGQHRFVLGSGVASRNTRESETSLGMFVNNILVRCDIDPDDSFASLLAAVGHEISEALVHDELPFELLVRDINPARRAAQNPLFQISFSAHDSALPGLKGTGLDAEVSDAIGNGTAKFDLDIIIVPDAGPSKAAEVVWNYSTDLFTPETAHRLSAAYAHLIEQCFSDVDRSLSHLSVLSPSDRDRAIEAWNDTATPYPDGAAVHELFEAQARSIPEATAAVYQAASLTYGELNARANRLAHHLRTLGVGPDVRVAICVERSLEMVVSLLAILKAGGVYVPLDPAYPPERLAFMLADAEPAVVLTHAPARAVLDGLTLRQPVIDLEADAGLWAAAAATDLAVPDLTSRHLAYVIYTSGSTGTPKGVMVEHRSVVRLVKGADYVAIGRTDTLLNASSIAFDATTFEVWGALLNGARLVLYPHRRLDVADLIHVMNAHQVTVVWMTARLFDLYALQDRGCPTLTHILAGGEALSPPELARCYARDPRVQIINGYGPTENTTFSLCHQTPRDHDWSQAIPIGRPITNSRAYVLDRNLEPVPIGVAGEIHVGGAGVARGYLKRPELTAEKFIASPFVEGDRLYKTGDLGRYRPDGVIEFLGRNDFQVKIRGFRIELGEIEAKLAAHPGVREAVVLAREDVTGDKRLVAYYTADDEIGVEALRGRLATGLPEYMVPAAYVRLQVLPLTPNGKLDRKALPAPDGGAYVQPVYAAPQGPVEEALAQIWSDLLGVDRVGRHDNFFDLGGHSLLAVRMISRVRHALGREVTLSNFFAEPVLGAFARSCESQSPAETPKVSAHRGGGPAGLSFAQQRLWFLSQMEGVSEAYHMPLALRLGGPLDVAVLGSSLDGLVARHEALRTRFVTVDGEPRQVAGPAEAGFGLEVQDLSGRVDAEAACAGIRRAEASAPFDLERGPLIRGRLIRLGAEDHVLLVTMHHIVSDGWSMGILTRELGVLYGAYSRGEESPLAPLEIQYADYAAWQRTWLSGDVLAEQSRYWKDHLLGSPALLELPCDRPRPAVQDYHGGVVGLELDEALTAELKALGRRHGLTLYMVLLAGWSLVLSRLSGQTDVVVGSPSANRTRSEVEGLIGFFVNTLALRVDLSGDPSVAELLARVKAAALGAQDHQDLPFEQVVEQVHPVRSLSHTPVFQALFAWQNNEAARFELGDLAVSALGGGTPSAKFDLSLDLGEADGRIAGGLTYATALFDRETVERWGGYLRQVLAEMARAPQAQAAGLPMLSEAEQRQVLVDWNDTASPYPDEALIHELFEARVAEVPDAVALIHEAASLTYGELNARANRLARHLRTLGVGPDIRVAICVERSLEMVVGLLAILKAGGAYVPLDPAYPAERLAFMLGDSDPAVVLTHAPARAALGAAMAALAVRPPVIDLEADTGLWAEASDATELAVHGLTSRNLAYVIYTSGSTGTPKGVMVEHRGVVNYCLQPALDEMLTRRDTIAAATTLTFDIAVTELLVPLLRGARADIVPAALTRDAPALVDYLAGRGITTLQATPSTWRMLATLDRALPRMKGLVGGEVLPTDLARWVLARTEASWNMYGPTEATVWATSAALEDPGRKSLAQIPSQPIGRPLANYRVYLLDEHLQPVPIGVAGEIHIGGAGVARGYLNRPELTAEKFIASPFVEGDRLYKTGDLGRYRPDGVIEFLGRNDFQVKIRGFRIELGEIEARLATHPGVREAVALAREDIPGDKRLVGYYTAEAPIEVEALRSHLAGGLPEYMVPAAYVRLEALPLTPNGKLDRKALPAPDGEAYTTAAYAPPQGPVEEALAQIWCDLLSVERVGRHDNFFDLGGHSLLAIRVLERMRREGLQGDVRMLFATPTLADLAQALDGGVDTAVTVPPNLIPPDCKAITPAMLPLVDLTQGEIDTIVAATPGGASNIQDIYPLAPLQEGILFHHLMGGEGDTYLLRSLMRFADRGTLDRFAAALNAVIARHDILRTAVLWEGLSDPVQVVRRRAVLTAEVAPLDPQRGAVLGQLRERFDPGRFRLSAGSAPMMRLYAAQDPVAGDWAAVWLLHHLVSDHATLDGVIAEVSSHLQEGEGALGPALPFRNFVAQARLGVSAAEHEAFFREMLGDIDGPTAPFGLLDVQGDGSGVAEARQAVSVDLAQRLRRQARRLGVSAASLFHVAWGQVVARTSGRADPVFGTVLFGRMQGGEGSDRVMGPFINTLPVRLRLGAAGAEAAVGVTHWTLSDLLRHEHASLALVQRCSAAPPQGPLFTALFNYRHSAPANGGEMSAWPGISYLGGEERTNYPLTFSAEDVGQGFWLTAQSVVAIDPARVCAMMHRSLESLALALEEAPQTPVGQLDVLPEPERRQLLDTWNDTASPYPDEALIHELFEARVAEDPDAVALIHGTASLSFGELNARANRLAHHLRGLGVGPDIRVAICVERSLEMVVGLLAILKAGGAYVPLDPAYPAERLAFMLGDSDPAVVLTHAPARAALGAAMAALGAGPPVIDLEADTGLWAEASDATELAVHGLTSRNLAYVIYTSGSTGTPKGVMNEHRGVVNRLLWMQRAYGLTGADAVLQKTPFSFDVSVWEFFWPLLAGARLVMARPGGHRDPDYLVEVINAERVTTAHFVPPMLQQFLETDASTTCASLRDVICSGEALPPALVERFGVKLPQAELHNLYGPTEAAIDVTAWTCGADASGGDTVPIGRPIANTRIYLLDEHLQPVPIGVAGEIYIGGAGVARGYLNRPELTAEKFIASPFVEGDRLYKTGDLGRYRPDGVIEFLGRNDFQVKIRGFRIELGEIEARLASHPGVREAVVLAREDIPGDKRLAAYYTAEAPIEVEGLRAHLAASLPEHMVPAAYIRLDALPLTPNGKLDRKALPAPDGEAYTTAAYAPPQGPVEEALAQIWSDLLGVDRVGRHDNFFDLGGHSLLAIRVLERMRREGLQGDVRMLFATPTLADLAQALDGGVDTAVTVPPNLIPPDCKAITPAMLPLVDLTQGEIDTIVAATPGGAGNIQDIYPLAPLQEGILFHHLMGGDRDPYLLQSAIHFADRGTLDRYVVALNAVIARHDILRTAVVWEGLGEPIQMVWRRADLAAEEVVLDSADGNPLGQLRSRFDPRTFRLELGEAPMMRLYAAKDLRGGWVAVLLYHHLVMDHTTLEVVQAEIAAHLGGRAGSLPPPLPFRTFVAQARLGVSAREHETFFREMLGDIEEPTAPFGLLDVQGDGSSLAEARQAVSAHLAQRLRRQARKLGVSAASLFHVAWGQVVARASGRTDPVFGTVLFGRMQGGEGADRVMGLLINTLPVRLRLGAMGTEAAVRDTHAMLTGLMRHEHASLALAQRCSALPALAPLFSTLLNYRHSLPAEDSDTSAWPGITYLGGEERTNYPLTFSVDDLGQGFCLTAQAVEALDPARVCALMHRSLESLAQSLEQAPDAPVGQLDVLPEPERRQLLETWNATEQAYPDEALVHELFEARVGEDPDAVALIHGTASLSYGELNARANRLAHHLRTLGVGPDVRVAICVERSLEMVVGLLATLKAGGAYVPLDPAYPAERLAFMLGDSDPAVVLTHAPARAALGAAMAALDVRPPVIDLEADASLWVAAATTDVNVSGLTSRNLAYVIYTSGSTGLPKGAMNEHHALVNLSAAQGRAFKVEPASRVLQFASFSFDAAAFETLMALGHGARLILRCGGVAPTAEDLADLLRTQGITHAVLTPAALATLPATSNALAGRTLLVAGEALSSALAQSWARGRTLFNLYGPTETAVWATGQHIDKAEGQLAPPIGRPIANTRIYLLDEHLQPVPIGVAGEIHIGGAGVARGYLNRPELTAEKFIASPFVEGDRLYKTGDLGRYRPDGVIEFLGRNDFQVKIRGFRIELGEIEARLATHPGVREAVALAREDIPGDKRLVGYYTAEAPIEVEALRSHLAGGLPEYMVPAAYVRLEALPLTPNGKLDRKALPAPDGEAYTTAAYAPPQGPVEEALAQIWCDLLCAERVGRYDNFFDLGGHSLIAVRMISRVRQALGQEVAIGELFAEPTLAGFARRIEVAQWLLRPARGENAPSDRFVDEGVI